MSHATVIRRFAAVVLVAFAAVLTLLATGCSGYPSTEEALKANASETSLAASATIEPGVLTVGVNAQNAPYAWPLTTTTSPTPTKLQGMDVDVALAMADEMGLTVKFVDVGSNYEAAAQGIVDVVMGVTAQTLPPSEVQLGNYLENAPALFGRNVAGSMTFDSLVGATVGVQTDSETARRVSEAAPSATLTGFLTLNDAFAALEAGSVNYVACESLMGGYLATGYSDIALAGAIDLPAMRGIAVSAANAAVQSAVTAAIDTLSAEGIIAQIREDWVGTLPIVSASNQVLAATVVPAEVPAEVPVEEPVAEEAAV